jgi:ribosomal protein S18 acetylase RimI-like enzyme
MDRQIVEFKSSQIRSAIEVLGSAFKDDPVFCAFAFKDERRRLHSIEWMSRLMLNYARHDNAVYTTGRDLKGVAIWLPPDRFPLNNLRLLQVGGYALPFQLQLTKLPRFISIFLKIEALHKIHAARSHWYLMMLGVGPAYQNQGVGSALIQPILDKADRENMPCYLETSTAAAVRFYQRHGFKVVETIDLAPEQIQIWMMKREC